MLEDPLLKFFGGPCHVPYAQPDVVVDYRGWDRMPYDCAMHNFCPGEFIVHKVYWCPCIYMTLICFSCCKYRELYIQSQFRDTFLLKHCVFLFFENCQQSVISNRHLSGDGSPYYNAEHKYENICRWYWQSYFMEYNVISYIKQHKKRTSSTKIK